MDKPTLTPAQRLEQMIAFGTRLFAAPKERIPSNHPLPKSQKRPKRKS